ncbi:MAG: hypothetical protein H7Y88_13680 [Phycisphaerales bacterium]|nr:hypothetical protein [Phycisphaerales bacterium]
MALAFSRPRTILSVALTVAVAGSALSLSGCVGYTATPASQDESIFSSPNAPATHDLMAVSLRWVIRRYPPSGGDGRYTIWDDQLPTETTDDLVVSDRVILNLPRGVRRSVYRRILERVSPLAHPVTVETIAEGLPIYHVGRVFITGDEAKVDIFKPVTAIGNRSPSGEQLYQAVTVRLRGGFKPWHVTSHHVWTVGALPVPPLAYMSVDDNAFSAPLPAPVEAAPSEAAPEAGAVETFPEASSISEPPPRRSAPPPQPAPIPLPDSDADSTGDGQR